jgi:drug/metabolite transporter (DMT)-like permease
LKTLNEHVFIFATIGFTVYSQLIMRWRVDEAGPLPFSLPDQVGYVSRLLMNAWVMSGIIATFLAGISWMLAMTKFEISYAYPFVSLTYVLVMAASFFLFGESMSLTKVAGTIVVVAGITLIAQG